MPTLGTLHQQLTVTVTSPDAQIRATRREVSNFDIRFRPGTFATYRAEQLEHQLSTLLTLLWQGWRDGCRQVITAVGGEPHGDDHRDWDANRRRYRQAADEQESRGQSPDKRIRVRAVGMRTFTVRIRPGSLPEFAEETFTAQLLGAIHSLMHDEQRGLSALKDGHFDTRLRTSKADRSHRSLQGAHT